MIATDTPSQTKAEPNRVVRFDSAKPVRIHHRNRTNVKMVSLRILDQSCRAVESHGLVIQQANIEFRWAVHFQPGTRIGNESETNGVRVGKSIESKRSDG